MSPRILQIIARLQQAAQAQGEAANLLLQELAETKAAEDAAKPKEDKTDG